MDAKLKRLILDLCDKTDEVVGNNDWPTTDGSWTDDGEKCTCPMHELTQEIRRELSKV